MPPTAGRLIARRYFLEELIGRGAMGIVWRARDQVLDRKVAVKEVLLDAAIDACEMADRHERMQREARTAARLSHPNIVTVYDVIEDEGRPWIVMELVPAPALDEVLAAQGPLTAPRAARIGQQLLAALTAAHQAGVLHRDVKPSNVLIAPDVSADGRRGERAVLTDFGIAQFEGADPLTLAGTVIGSPGFTAPERLYGANATPASDLWSLGATLYTAVEGHGPYERADMRTAAYAIIYEDAPPAPSAGRLAPLIRALLQRNPADRPSARIAARMFAEALGPTSNEPIGPRRGDPQLSVLPAPLAPPAPRGEPTQTFPSFQPRIPAPQTPPQARSWASSDAPGQAGLLSQFNGVTSGAPPPERRGRRRRFARKPVVMTAGFLGAAVVAITIVIFAPRFFHGTVGQAAAIESSPAASAGGLPTTAPAAGLSATVVNAINHHSDTTPAGDKVWKVRPSAVGKTGGFSIDAPSGWGGNSMGQGAYQYTPDNVTYLEIDLAQHTMSNLVAEANYLSVQQRVNYPGYRPIAGTPAKPYILSATILGTAGALWQFDFGPSQATMTRVDILLFTWRQQSYTIKMTSPAGTSDKNWNTNALPTMAKMLNTFTPLSA